MTDIERIVAGDGERPQWWRLTVPGCGLKRFLPDRAVRYAEQRGYRYVRFYEPVCENCPALRQHLLQQEAGNG